MELIVVENYHELSQRAAEIVTRQVAEKHDSVLGLATGSTPLGCYREMIQKYREQQVSFAKVTTLNLDEYVGLPPTHQHSYHHFMKHELFHHIDINEINTHIPEGASHDLKQACIDYESKIDWIGPPDLQLLGIGANGHIGFNEPGSSFDSYTHIVELAASTREANARFFTEAESVPTHAITMGISSILKSKKILLLASGERKAQAIRKLLNGEIDEHFPASSLCRHPNVTLIADRAAYSLAEQEGEPIAE